MLKKISRWLSQEFHAWLAGVISWEEKALAILNGPVLKYAAFAAALVMRIPALAGVPGIDIAYVCFVLIGVDVQYIACWRNAVEHRGWVRVGWVAVALLLGIPFLQTNAVFTLHAQTNMPELAAMAVMHLTPTAWAIECAVLMGLLMAISAISRPKHQLALVTVTPAPTPATPPPPTAPDKPRSSKPTTRRNTGRTVEETEALKRLVTPKVVALRNAGTPYQAIADQLDITKFMVQQILKDDKRAATQEVA